MPEQIEKENGWPNNWMKESCDSDVKKNAINDDTWRKHEIDSIKS